MEVKIRLAGPALGTGEPGTRIDTVRWRLHRLLFTCCTALDGCCWLQPAAWPMLRLAAARCRWVAVMPAG